MTTTPPSPAARRRLFADLSPLTESKPAGRLMIGWAISNIGSQMTVVAIGLQIYELTHSTFAVSLVGGFTLLPLIVFGIYGGMLADAFDRRVVLIGSALIAWASTITIAALAWLHVDVVWPLYVLSVLTGTAATVSGTVRGAILPRLLPARLLPAAAAINGIGMGTALTVGPALAGILVAAVGFPLTYTVDVVLFLAALFGIVTLPSVRPEGHSPHGWASIASGIDFLRTAPNVRMSFIVDIIAMTFGRPYAIFPAAGAILIGGGAVTVGVLTAAGAVGALLSGIVSGRLVHVRRQGLAVGWAIAVYGASILALGVIFAVMATGALGHPTADWAGTNLVALSLASACMAISGASDNVSSIFRQTILQVAAPDGMRGRLQGIFSVVVTGGPRLGDLYVGFGVALTAVWFPPVLGGALIIALMAVLLRVAPSFRRYDALAPTP
ncbi:MFS transporter [Galbitalea soli]|uniref:MFS transporter n=1 Tax=Galbitalea soli TaxID=1268042 RepID=A0A7C9TPQ6_9MICO|nr:MFS transporter [Galbitalea soli]NEM90381.1 MFS transporter [Galbitalea soli]NYJ31091.1 MFS family permease [Galbitalea soli]